MKTLGEYSDAYSWFTKFEQLQKARNPSKETGFTKIKQKIVKDFWKNKEEILSQPETKLKATKKLNKTIKNINKKVDVLLKKNDQ